LKKRIVLLFKFAIPLAIIAWLLAMVDREGFRHLWQQEKNWPMLIGGFALVMTAVCFTFVRWYLLVRALRVPFRVADAFRLGFLGYLMNFIGVGSVGGDLFKALFIAHEQPGRRMEAVATVLIDRVVGFFALLLVTSSAILLNGVSAADSVVRAICDFTLLATAAAVVVAVLVLVPRFSRSRMVRALGRIPKVGPIVTRLVFAVEVYRRKLGMLALATGVAIGVHASLPASLYLLAAAIFDSPPTLAEHYIIVPLSMVAGALPLTPGGLGEFEVAMDVLYNLVPVEGRDYGIIVALAYRLITILIAAIGVVYYWSSRREVAEVLEEAESEQK